MNKALLKKLLMENLTPLPNHDYLLDNLIALKADYLKEDMDEFIETCMDKVVSLKYAQVTLGKDGLTSEEAASTILQYNKYRNHLFTPNHNYIYVKLETGGFTGYDSRLGKIGEKVYPVLRVTLMYKDKIFDKYINPRGAEEHIHDSTKTYLSRTGTYDKALASEIGISEVNDLLAEWIKECRIPVHNPGINCYRHLVSANTKFNDAFIYNHLPALRRLTGPQSIDINLMINTLETSGVPIVPLNVYADDNHQYLRQMQKYHEMVIQGLSYV